MNTTADKMRKLAAEVNNKKLEEENSAVQTIVNDLLVRIEKVAFKGAMSYTYEDTSGLLAKVGAVLKNQHGFVVRVDIYRGINQPSKIVISW